MSPPEGSFDAIIRTYEHQMIKVTVFASHRPSSRATYNQSRPAVNLASPTAPPPSPKRITSAMTASSCDMASVISSSKLETATGSFSRVPSGLSSEQDGTDWATLLGKKRRRDSFSLIWPDVCPLDELPSATDRKFLRLSSS